MSDEVKYYLENKSRELGREYLELCELTRGISIGERDQGFFPGEVEATLSKYKKEIEISLLVKLYNGMAFDYEQIPYQKEIDREILQLERLIARSIKLK